MMLENKRNPWKISKNKWRSLTSKHERDRHETKRPQSVSTIVQISQCPLLPGKHHRSGISGHEDISKYSCLSDRHVSVKKTPSQSHTSNSASRSSQRDRSRILCIFFVNTCSRMNSGWKFTSLAASGHSVEPIPHTSFL